MYKRGVFCFLFLTFFFLVTKTYGGTTPFITTWKTDNPGESANNQIIIPTFATETYNYTVDWGDGNITTHTGRATHTYATPGTYTVSITGTFPRIYFFDLGDKDKLLTIEQWGNNAWASMENAFAGCRNLQGNFTDTPNLSNVKSMQRMFFGAIKFNSYIDNWDVSNITNMSGLFSYATNFNQDIGGWDVSNVTDMSEMFYFEYPTKSFFNQDIGRWDVSNVTNMSWMFSNATSFNQYIGDWDVSKVTNMSGMFFGAISFNQDIGGWDVSKVTNMYAMFSSGMFVPPTPANIYPMTFNQDISGWDTSNVVYMQEMFAGGKSFNQDIGSWDVSKVVDMFGMFADADSFNQDIGIWDVANVTNMTMMFFGAEAFNQDIGFWDVGNVNNLNAMFSGATSFNQDISQWNVSNIISMHSMFTNATSFNQDIGRWNMGNVTLMLNMFSGATSFNQNIGNWNVGNVIDMTDMFANATSFNQDIGNWNVTNVVTMESMFANAISFDQNLGRWNVINVTNMANMFAGVTLSIANYDALLIGWDKIDLQHNVNFHGGNSKYCAGTAARENMMSSGNWTRDFSRPTDNWTITDGGSAAFYINTLSWQFATGSYTLPPITGYGLSGSEQYYTQPNGKGKAYKAGDIILFEDFSAYPVTLYIFDKEIAGCAEEQAFKLSIAPQLACTTLLLPLPNATNVPVGTNISWDFAPNAKGYKLSVGTVPGGTDILNAFDVGNKTIYNLPDDLPEHTTIYVRIIPYNTQNELDDCTEASFTTESFIVLPSCTMLSAPLSGATNVPVNTSLTWNPAADTTGYTLSVGTTSGGSDILNTLDVGNTTGYSFPTHLPENTVVYVRIIPYNLDGDATDCSEEYFTTEMFVNGNEKNAFPKFFTPNNDGRNDIWTVPNPLDNILSVHIFDRYGKLIKTINEISEGWDGNFNGKSMPVNDYWYFITYNDGRTLKGHFSLVR
ncbi:BspA family leucine-rich repeat surface protein [Mariniflexile gromovii]|uniref:BspA family leucine-rich repeat surface protein n=1 Tax=Mariniflexile gromovii TaxID=362523 RepID=A0ABS4BXR9_9FLAO|nr:BspA family leucine-rich repeat surface protein [Mariniflexile gromovii]MBP0904811.1 BspA family leucine-rich repeat surface protein [Mariniflexile gromovii]